MEMPTKESGKTAPVKEFRNIVQDLWETGNEARRIQIGITGTAFFFVALHIVAPWLYIDNIVLVLLVIAAIPWLIQLIKSFKSPSEVKIEIEHFDQLKEESERAGLLAPEKKSDYEYPFQSIADENPNLALAGLRIEIEKKLKKIAKSHDIDSKRLGLGQVLTALSEKKLLTKEQLQILEKLSYYLNQVIHGATLDKKVAESAMKLGIRLLKGLDDALSAK